MKRQEALVFKASRGIEDLYELTCIRKDGTRFPAIVSVTGLRDAPGAIIGYLLIGTDNTARKQIEAEQEKLAQRLRDHQFYTRSLLESIGAPFKNSFTARDRTLPGVIAAARDVEILDLAVIESGKLSLSVEPVSLAEVMTECQAMIEQQANKGAWC